MSNKRTLSMAMDADHILTHQDVGGLVLEQLSLAELATLADAKPTMQSSIKALEQKWLRGCVELCGGSWRTLSWLLILKDGAWLDAGSADDWMAAWRTLEAKRREFLTEELPQAAGRLQLPETLPWGEEEWTRLRSLPDEAAMREAFARCQLYHPSLVDGLGDDQCDTYPVGVAFYKRTAQTAEGLLGPEDAYEENILQLRKAIHPCSEDHVEDVDKFVMAPISVTALLSNLPSPVAKPSHNMGSRRVQQAIYGAATNCSSFVSLCVGDTPALTPVQAIEVLDRTCKYIVNDGCECAADDEWDVRVGATGEYDDDPEMGPDDEWSYFSKLGIDQVERALKAQLAAVAAKYGLTHEALTSATSANATFGLAWDAGMAAAQTVAEATQATFEGYKAELASLIASQLRAAHGDKSLDELTVRPVVLTNSDCTAEYWSDANHGGNDHEGVQAIAFVSETWALVVVGKSASC